MATPWVGTTPVGSCQLALSHWNQISGKILTWPPTYQKGLNPLKGREGCELESTKIRSNTGKMICKDQLENKQSATAAKGRRLALASTLHHVMYALGVIPLTPVKHKSTTSIGSILTLPKLHSATSKYVLNIPYMTKDWASIRAFISRLSIKYGGRFSFLEIQLGK